MDLFDYFTRVNFNEEDLANILKAIIKEYHFASLKE